MPPSLPTSPVLPLVPATEAQSANQVSRLGQHERLSTASLSRNGMRSPRVVNFSSYLEQHLELDQLLKLPLADMLAYVESCKDQPYYAMIRGVYKCILILEFAKIYNANNVATAEGVFKEQYPEAAQKYFARQGL